MYRQGLKQLTYALKDLNEILIGETGESKEDKIDKYLSKLEDDMKHY